MRFAAVRDGRCALVLLLVLVWAGAVAAQDLSPGRPEDVGLSAERLARIDRAMEAAIGQQRMAGAVAIIARNGKIVHHKAYGLADVDARRPMRTDDMFRLYSMTKPIVSVALLTLYEEGRFQLTDPLEKFIPGFRDVKVIAGTDANGGMILEPARRKPTVQDAFRHTLGLVSGLGPGPLNARYRELGLVMEKIPSLRQEIETLATLPLEYHPGERWVYGLGHDVQAYLVEHFSGMPLDRYLKERLFDPLGMKDTVYGIPPSHAARFANTYEPAGKGLKVRETATTGLYTRLKDVPLGTVGLSSTAADYLRFAQMLLNEGELDGKRILGRKTVELLRQNHLPKDVRATANSFAPNASGYGLGFSVTIDPAAGGILDSMGAFGWSGAATTKFYVDPAENLVAVFCAQKWPFDVELLNEFQTLLYQSIVR